jgi:hypothetical protein
MISSVVPVNFSGLRVDPPGVQVADRKILDLKDIEIND